MNKNVRKLIVLAMFSSICVIATLLGKLTPAVIGFLQFDPKDAIITICGFVFGTWEALVVAVISSFIELVSFSGTGIIGFVMNVLGSAFFACTAAFVYKKHRSITGAVTGLILGGILMTAVMLLWNYILTPLYMEGVSREAVAKLLLPVFLPFNLIKGGINCGITLLLYKPTTNALRQARLLEKREAEKKHSMLILYIAGGVVVIACTLCLLLMCGVI